MPEPDFDVNIKVDDEKIQKHIDGLLDNISMERIHELFAKLIDPYVPEGESGNLSQALDITPEYVRYKSVYAHYHYVGIVYGPNFPVLEGGTLGWRSPKKKYPTEREIGEKEIDVEIKPIWEIKGKQYIKLINPEGIIWHFGRDRTKHPLATKEWDKAAMQNPEIKKKFTDGVINILRMREKELNG